MVVHETRWSDALNQLIAFRQRMRGSFGLLMREEIHSAHLINRPGDLVRIPRNDRLTIIRAFLNEVGALPDVSVINVLIDKHGKPTSYDVMGRAWEALIQRFSNTISHRNFAGPANSDERGTIVPDNTDTKKVQGLIRRMRRYNPIPNQSQFGVGFRNRMITNMVEDPYFKDSRRSYFIQAADVIAFALYQRTKPCAYIKRKSARNYFNRLESVLFRTASTSDPEGIVRL